MTERTLTLEPSDCALVFAFRGGVLHIQRVFPDGEHVPPLQFGLADIAIRLGIADPKWAVDFVRIVTHELVDAERFDEMRH